MTINEQYVNVGEELIFVRHTDILRERPTLLFLHGLGDSGFCFLEAFSCALLSGFNLIAPDHVGYGRSSRASDGDYSFAAQIRRFRELLSILEMKEVSIIGHSLGGILGTLWAGSDHDGLIQRLVNVEGNLTSADATYSKLALDAFDELHEDFDRWCAWFLSEFAMRYILDQPGVTRTSKRYYGSLLFARPTAFLTNAQEIVRRAKDDRDNGMSEIGKIYRTLDIRRIYFWGSQSLSADTREFLAREGLMSVGFHSAGHWPMIDDPDGFYRALADFLG